MLRKLTGKQATIVILGVALLIGFHFAWQSWLEAEKEIRLQELRNKEHAATLQAVTFANSEQMATYKKIIDVLGRQGQMGERALMLAQTTNVDVYARPTRHRRAPNPSTRPWSECP